MKILLLKFINMKTTNKGVIASFSVVVFFTLLLGFSIYLTPLYVVVGIHLVLFTLIKLRIIKIKKPTTK